MATLSEIRLKTPFREANELRVQNSQILVIDSGVKELAQLEFDPETCTTRVRQFDQLQRLWVRVKAERVCFAAISTEKHGIFVGLNLIV